MRTSRMLVALAALAAILSLSTAALGAGRQGAATGKVKIALSNSYIGNKWRIEMENLFKAACGMAPYKAQVECSVYNSGNDVSKQTQQISNLISQRVDAIVVNAASPTGLNGIIAQACARKILVVSYDNVVTAPCALKVNTDQYEFGKQLAQYLVDKLHGKGNVIMVTGVAGTHVDEERNRGAEDVFKRNPGIKIVSKYTGMWDSATAQRNTASQLPSLPKIDGIWCQGGTDGVLKAFIAAKRPLPVTAGEAENGFRKFMTGYLGKKLPAGLSFGQPPFLVLVSLELARSVLSGQQAREDIEIPFPAAASAPVKVNGVSYPKVKEGETVFAKLPDSFFDDFTDAGPKATVKICVGAAISGKPCPGTLRVRLPKAS